MKLMIKLIVGVLIAAILYIGASPFVTLYHIKSAVDDKNKEELLTYIDYPELQKNLSVQLEDQIQNFLGVESNTDLGNLYDKLIGKKLSPLVEQASEKYVTEQALKEVMNLAVLYQEQKHANKESNSQAVAGAENTSKKLRWKYKSYQEFIVWLPKEDQELELVFERKGLVNWQITNIILPELL